MSIMGRPEIQPYWFSSHAVTARGDPRLTQRFTRTQLSLDPPSTHSPSNILHDNIHVYILSQLELITV